MWLNWGVFVLGLVVFLVGCLWMHFYGKAYQKHVARYGRFRFGKEYGRSWTEADARGVVVGRGLWTIGILAIVSVLLFKFTGLPDIGVPLWAGSSLGISGVLVLILAQSGSIGLAKREVEIELARKEEEQRKV